MGAFLALATPAAAQNVYHTPQGLSPHPVTWAQPVAPQASAGAFGAVLAPSSYTMFDSITVSTVPSWATAVAGYTAGFWPTYLPLVRAFPHALHISIAISARYHADCLDVESGDASPSQVVGWFYADRAAGFAKPCVYSSLWEYVNEIRPLIARAHIARSSIIEWDANYTFVPHIDSGFDGTQFTELALHRNLDESLIDSAFENIHGKPVPTKPVAPQVSYSVFPNICFPRKHGCVNERLTVERFDGAISHVSKYRPYITRVLQPELHFLAQRVAFLAITEHLGWGGTKGEERGPRYQLLSQRAAEHVK